MSAFNLGMSLLHLHRETGVGLMLADSVGLQRAAAGAIPPGNVEQYPRCINLAVALPTQWTRSVPASCGLGTTVPVTMASSLQPSCRQWRPPAPCHSWPLPPRRSRATATASRTAKDHDHGWIISALGLHP